MKALLSFKQIEKAVATSADLAGLASLVSWITDFVALPHKDVGRQGPVCPFMPRALNSNSLLFADLPTKNLTQGELQDLVKSYAETFLTTEPTRGKARLNKAIVLTLQDIATKDIAATIEGTQRELKRYFVERGLMLGEFHATHQGRGIRNEDFFPLQSPIPLLVIRHMIPSDLPFLSKTSDSPMNRLLFLTAYAKSFFWRVPKDRLNEFAIAVISTLRELMPHVKIRQDDFNQPMATST